MIKAINEKVELAMLPKVKKSGGPTSKKGKKAVSQNATKSGVYSRSIILPTEDKKAYQELLTRYMAEFSPLDMAQTTMVTSLANLTWRKMRLDHYEQNSLITEWEKHVSFSDLKEGNLIYFHRDILWLELQVTLGSYLKISLADLDKNYRELESSIKNIYSQEVNTHYLERFFAQNQELLKAILDVAAESFHRKDIEVKDLLIETTFVNHKDEVLLEACTDKILEKQKDIAWYRDNEEKINQAKLKLKEKRLMEKMNQTEFTRAHDELDRSFYRTLSELRKHQYWRREQNEVVVIQEDSKK